MRFEIYTVKGSYCYLMDYVDNGAGARHDFNLTENGYCFTYYDIMPDGAIYTSYYYVASSYYLEIVARSTSVFTTTGESTTYEIMREGDYVLPQSSSAYLTIADLEGLSAAECRLARNEIYARHGRIFLAEDLKAYFESKSWYRGTIHPDNFTEDMLNQYELYNRDLITQYETDNGYNQ